LNQSSANTLGVVAGGVLLMGAFIAPRLFPSTPSAGSPAALKSAEEARRQVAAFNEGLSRLAAEQDMEALKKADPEKLAALTKGELDERTKPIADFIGRARATDRKTGLEPIRMQPPSGDANMIRVGAESLDKLAAANAARLNSALVAAKKAVAEGSNAVGVNAMLGLANAVQASDLLSEARRMRTNWNDLRAEVLAAAADWTITKTELDHFSGLSTKEASAGLEGDAGEFDGLITEAKKEVDDLSAIIAERKKSLDAAQGSLAQSRQEMTRVEQQSFQAGNDSSFTAMKSSMESISRNMADLQEQQHLLVHGGMKGAKFADDEFATGAMEGGEEFLGLEELERRQSVASDRLTRLTRGRQAIGKQVEDVNLFGKSARTEATRLTEQLVAEEKAVQAILDKMIAMNDAVVAKENEALAAARAALGAFQADEQASRAWADSARTQKSADPEGRNERLKMITSDETARNRPEFAKAEANALLGQIYAERVAGLEAHRDILERLTKVIKGSTAKLTPIKESLDTARNEANTALANSKAAYDKLAGDSKFGWMARISAASVAASAAKVDSSKAAELTSSAREHVREAAKKAGRHWAFNIHYQMLKDWLAPGEPTTETQPSGEGPSDTSKPAPTPPGGG
jgi:hypothetical protein